MKAKKMLEFDSRSKTWAHAYLFIGNNKIEAQELVDSIIKSKKCSATDVSTVQSLAENSKTGEIKKEQIKNILHDVSLTPSGKCRIAVIFDAEKLNQSSGNILLKSLEEPPKNAMFILIAGNDSVLPTIKSRCRVIKLSHWRNGHNSSDDQFIKFMNGNFNEVSKNIESLVKNNETDRFFTVLEAYFEEKMISTKKVAFARALKEIWQTKKEIKGNANPRLALECLFLKLEKTI